MSHFAKVENGIVVQVIVAEKDFIDTLDDKDMWVQTSYNTKGGKHYDPNTGKEDDGIPLRKNYATIGGTYDEFRDAFIPPQQFYGWILNKETCLWEPPIPYPTDGLYYAWDKETQQWIEVKQW